VKYTHSCHTNVNSSGRPDGVSNEVGTVIGVVAADVVDAFDVDVDVGVDVNALGVDVDDSSDANAIIVTVCTERMANKHSAIGHKMFMTTCNAGQITGDTSHNCRVHRCRHADDVYTSSSASLLW
jgi:hypothetical protein